VDRPGGVTLTFDAGQYAHENLTALESRATVLGTDRRVILTHSPSLHTAQQVGLAQTLGEASAQLTELADRLARGKTRRPRSKVEAVQVVLTLPPPTTRQRCITGACDAAAPARG
jgi:hypothetical protein